MFPVRDHPPLSSSSASRSSVTLSDLCPISTWATRSLLRVWHLPLFFLQSPLEWLNANTKLNNAQTILPTKGSSLIARSIMTFRHIAGVCLGYQQPPLVSLLQLRDRKSDKPSKLEVLMTCTELFIQQPLLPALL